MLRPEQTPATGAATETLERAGRIVGRARACAHIKYAGDLAALAAAGFAAAVALDTWIGFAPIGRAALHAVWLAVLGIAAWRWRASREAHEASRVAGAAAGRCGLDAASVAAGVEFAQRPSSGDVFADALRGRAIERGLAALRSVDLSSAVDAKPAWRAAWRCAMVYAVIVAVALSAPGAAARGALRIMAPTGDHPPWSPIGLRVEIEPERVLVADDVLVRVVAERMPTARVSLVIESSDGATRRLPIGSVGNREGGLNEIVRVRNVRETLRVRAEHANARSRWVSIRPERRPRAERALIEIIPPAYTGWGAETTQIDGEPDATRIGAMVGSRARVTAWLTMEAEARADGAVAASSAGWAISAEWVFGEPGVRRVALDAETSTGVRLSAPIVVEIDVREDEPPLVQYQGAEMLDGGTARLGVVAQDDVALESLIAERRGDAGGDWALIEMLVTPTGGVWAGSVVVTAESLGLAPSGRAFVRFRARDARPGEFGGPNETIAGPIEIVAGSGGGGGEALSVSQMMRGVVFGASSESDSVDDAAVADTDAAAESGAGAAETESRAPTDAERAETRAGDRARERAGGAEAASRDGSAADATRSEHAGLTRGGATRQLGGFDPLGGVRALEYVSGERGAPLRGIEPSLLNRLGGRHRAIAARYFELLATRPARAERVKETP